MSNTFSVKVTVSPSGVIKLSHGSGSRVSARSVFVAPPILSILPNFKDDPKIEGDMYFLGDDCPSAKLLKVGYGLLGTKASMSAKSAKNLRERMCAVELEYGKENCLFGTLTLPSDDVRSYEVIARYSAYLVNRFNVWIADNFSGMNMSRCGVWEYQKRGALHYHFLLGSHCMDAINLDDFRHRLATFWMSALEALEVESGINFFSQKGQARDKSRLLEYDDLGKRFANVQVVEKSVCAYLSGYLSGSNHDNKKDKNNLRKKLFPVASWAQWNREATRLFNKYSIECSKVFWCEDFNSWSDLKSILLRSIPRAEGTAELKRSNPFWTSDIVISAIKGSELISTVNEWLGMIRDSGLCVSPFSLMKWNGKSKREKEDRRIEEFEHEEKLADIANFLKREKGQHSKARIAMNFGKKMANKLNEFCLNMLIWSKELETHLAIDKSLDCPLLTYHLLEANRHDYA